MDIVLVIFILLYSAIFHEIMHGYIAYRLGDPTAKILGRLTLNPVKHVDIFYTFLIPLSLYIANLPVIGGAKPVPVDLFNLRDSRKDYALISIAGPLTNIALAVVAAFLAHVLFPEASFGELSGNFIGLVLQIIIQLNLMLGIFNLLPIPPLDGSRLFALLLPKKMAASYLSIGEGYLGILLLMLLFYFDFGLFSLSGILFGLRNYSLQLLGF